MIKIFTLKHFLKIFRTLLPVLTILILLPAVYSQDTLFLSLKDTAVYDYDLGCSKIDSSKWSVKKDSCALYLPYLRKETLGTTILSYNFRINQTGNMESNDVAYFQIQLDSSEWITDTILHGSNYTEVHNLNGFIPLEYGEIIRFRVILVTNDQTEVWSVFWGKSNITGSFELYSDWPPPLENLPVELAFFTGTNIEKSIVLNWTTFSETNCDYYNIFRSDDGGKYKQIAFIDGAGNSNQLLRYAYVDEDKISGKVAYYMLRQVDFDGKDVFYGPVVVLLKHNNYNVSVFPNPAEAFSTISLSFPEDQIGSSQVTVFNSTGSEVLNSVVEDENFMFALSEPGLYIVAVTNNNRVSYNKLSVK